MVILKKTFNVLLSLTLLSVTVGGLYYFFNHSVFEIDQVEFKLKPGGDQFLFEKITKRQASRIQNKLVGQKIWKFSTEDLVARLNSDGNIKSVLVKRKLPSTIEVEVAPHLPLAVVLGDKNRLFPLSFEGELVPQLKKGQSLDLPVVRGLQIERKKGDLKRVARLLSRVPLTKGSFNRKKISEVIVRGDEGFEVIMVGSSQRVRLWGELKEEKIHQINQVMAYLKNKKIQSRVIDARFNKKIVVKLRNET